MMRTGLPAGRLDPEILELALAMSVDGRAPSEEELHARFPGRGPDVRAVLQAIVAYRSRVDALKSTGGGGNSRVAQLKPEARIGEFTVDGVIGIGAMGVVYRARQASLGDREVALKVLPPELVERDGRFVERFRREASLAAGIHHPNIAEVYGVGSDTDVLCFAMRLVEGRTLHDVLRELSGSRASAAEHRTSVGHLQRCVRLVRQLADALATIHAHGLVHRDVKPANVILEGEGCRGEDGLSCRPVLVDFGLLRPLGPSELTGTRTLLGTPAYASPETQLGREVDARADVFSLGALLYDLVTLTAPGTRPPASAGLPDPRAINPAVDARLAAILDMALQEDGRLRYADGSAFRRELDRYLRNEPVRALPNNTVGRLKLWAARRPVTAVKVGAAAGVLLLVLSGALVWMWMTADALRTASAEGRRMEAEGDLVGAAGSLRLLYDSRDPARWLVSGDDLELAERYWAPGEPLAELVRLLDTDDQEHWSGQGNLATPQRRRLGRERLEEAHLLIRQILFDPIGEDVRPVVRGFLGREIGAERPEQRRRLALATWADYLLLEPGQAAWTGPVRARALALVRGEDPQSHYPEMQRYAVAVLSGLPDPEVFETVVDLIGSEDVEVAFLAAVAAHRISTFVLQTKSREEVAAEQDQVVLCRWVTESFERTMTASSAVLPWMPKDAFGGRFERCMARVAWIRNVLRECGRLDPRLWQGLPPELELALDQVEAWVMSGLQGLHEGEPWQGRTPPRIETGFALLDAWCARNTSSRPLQKVTGESNADYEFEKQIWVRPKQSQLETIPIPPDRLAGPSALVDFALAPPRVQGDWLAAVQLEHALLDVDPDSHGRLRFLKLDRPGWSSLRVVCDVPPGARSATVRLLHERAGRWVVPRGGIVRIALTIPESGYEAVRTAPFLCSKSQFELGWDDFSGHEQISVQVSVRNANTTYRLYSVEIDWWNADGDPVRPRER